MSLASSAMDRNVFVSASLSNPGRDNVLSRLPEVPILIESGKPLTVDLKMAVVVNGTASKLSIAGC